MTARGDRTPNEAQAEPISDISELGAERSRSDVAPRFAPSGIVPRPASIPPSLPPSSGAPLSLEAELIARVHQAFAELAGPDSVLDTKKLKRSLDVKSVFIAERVLAVFDKNRDGLVSRVEFVRGVPRLLFGSTLDKLRFVFRVHDLNADGVIDGGELTRMLELGLSEDGVSAKPEVVRRLAELLRGAADANHDGLLSFREFETIAARHPECTALIARSEASWIAPHGELVGKRDAGPGPAQRFVRFVDNHPVLAATIVLWAAANVGLFVDAVLTYRALGKNELVQLARGTGACINLNGALIALTMARRTITWARHVPFLRRLPLDDSVAVHRALGIALLGLALVHSVAHGANWALTTPSLWATLLGSGKNRGAPLGRLRRHGRVLAPEGARVGPLRALPLHPPLVSPLVRARARARTGVLEMGGVAARPLGSRSFAPAFTERRAGGDPRARTARVRRHQAHARKTARIRASGG